MSIILQQIEKAIRRAGSWDPAAALDDMRDKTPRELAAPEDKSARRRFLHESLGDPREAEQFFERIIGGNELQDVNYLARGTQAARAVARIAVREPNGRQVAWGSGFLIAPQVLVTNHHVLPGPEWAVRSEAQFEYERDIEGHIQPFVAFRLLPEQLFITTDALDFSVVAVAPRAENAERELAVYGALPLLETTGKVTIGEWLTIIQHPNGEQKQVCVRENRMIKTSDDVVWYSADTLGGSSGSPVFNNDWYVVALHHSGVPEKAGDRIQTIDGHDWDPNRDSEEKIKWIANEGIRASRIVQTLREQRGQHPLLQPLFSATPESARVEADPDVPSGSDAPVTLTPLIARPLSPPIMSQNNGSRMLTLNLELDSSGGVRLLAPSTQTAARETTGVFEKQTAATAATSSATNEAAIDVPFDADYSKRAGFKANFLEGVSVHLPKLSPALEAVATRLIADPGKYVLHYHNYSVVMHAERRVAIYSAANLRGDQRFNMNRPPDVWREDPRIPLKAQLTNFYYKNNQFDRGHLTRREDLEFGPKPMDALQSAADTCHWTNCTPQHAKFNQNKELWQGIERHVLEDSIQNNAFNAQVFTGPILEEDDPVWNKFPTIQYPVRFWKVVAAINSKQKLFATAYILDQSGVIAQYGVEAAGEIPFTPYKTFQVKIAEVERLTGLKFTYGAKPDPLSDCDPLATKPPASRRRRARPFNESLGVAVSTADIPDDYLPLDSVGDIRTEL